MTQMIWGSLGPVEGPGTSFALPSTGGFVKAEQRLPTDPYYYADVEIQNAVVGSRYMLGWSNSGTFTEFSPGFEGTVSTSTFTLSSVPALDTTFLLWLRMRKGSAATKYLPLNQFATHNASGIVMYVSQVEDEVA